MCRINVACLLNKGGITYMTIVVKKVPKFLRGFVKLIFGIKFLRRTIFRKRTQYFTLTNVISTLRPLITINTMERRMIKW